MCAIVGIADSKGVAKDTSALLRQAMDAQYHRGPDDSGIASFPFAVLGHRRLSIIDLSGGHQPMATEDGKLWIVFNGEIYNYQDLREELIARGYEFRTNSDTEVLLQAYREFGSDCPSRLNGIFAFAILDTETQEIFLARDHLGVKPLYYALAGDRLYFSSELKGFKAFFGKTLKLDLEGLDCFLAYRYVIAPSTLLHGVKKLRPGHYAIWRNASFRETAYWDIPTDRKEPTTAVEAQETLRFLLRDAVRRQMIADVPLGVMLSGGIDSTIVTALMYEAVGRGIKTFSVATSGGGSWDERPFARLVSRRYETDHYELEINPETYIASLGRFAWDMDDLVADPASILLYHLCGLARRHVTVALSGEGSDELFAGYNYYMIFRSWNRQRLFNRLPSILLPLLRTGARYSPRLERYVRRYHFSEPEYASDSWAVSGMGLPAADRVNLVRPELTEYCGRSHRDWTWSIYRDSRADHLINHCLYADSKTWLPDNLLTKADRMSMAQSLELRVPFLDYRIVEFCASLPWHFKLRPIGGQRYETKALLRDTFRNMIPMEVLKREKQGFTLNWQEILATKGKDLARDVLLSGHLDSIFNLKSVSNLIDRARKEDSLSAQALLSLTLFGLWYRHFFVL